MQSKDRTYQVIAIVALVIGVCALTVGFAAFTQNLNITSAAEVSPASTALEVLFSTSSSDIANGTLSGTATGTGASASAATLSDLTVSGIKANFTEPGQSVEYNFNVYNNSEFTAYLTGVTFVDVETGKFQVCAAKTGSSNPATNGVSDACNDIELKLYVGPSTGYLINGVTTSVAGNGNGGINDSTGIASKASTPVKVVITYKENGDVADGDFTVTFGEIKLTYSSVSIASSGS